LGEPFKLEILDSIKTEPITIYHIGDEWWDLCAGPHVESTGKIPKKAVALQSVAGAYWRGDEKREMLQRIYATAWKDPKQLKQYKKMMEEAKKRDHRMLGKKLDLFSIQVRVDVQFGLCSLLFVFFSSDVGYLFLLACVTFCVWYFRKMRVVGLCFGILKDPLSVGVLKTSGNSVISRMDTTSSTLPILPI
jgi:hypothetical protein